MNIKTLLSGLLQEGKNEAEIAEALISYKGEDKPMDTGALAKAVEDARAERELLQKLTVASATREKEAREKAASEEMQSKIDKMFEEKMLSLNLKLNSPFSESNVVKRYDKYSGKIIEVKESDTNIGFKDMLHALSKQDKASAYAISDEIAKENFRVRNGSKATPSVTDVDSRGGLTIPIEVNNRILQLQYAQSKMMQLCNKDTIIYQSKLYPSIYGITVGYIDNQSATILEKNPTFAAASIEMQRIGGYSALSHDLVREKGNDIIQGFINEYASSSAAILDQQITIGCMTGNGDKVNGIVFDANTKKTAPKALVNLTLNDLRDLRTTLDYRANSRVAMLAGQKVYGHIGTLENTAGQYIFPQFIQGSSFAPFGIPFYEIPQIDDTLDVGGANRTTGTDSVLIMADMSKVMIGVDEGIRIDMSSDILFLQDAMAMRVIQDFGCKVLLGETNAGIVAVAQELTN